MCSFDQFFVSGDREKVCELVAQNQAVEDARGAVEEALAHAFVAEAGANRSQLLAEDALVKSGRYFTAVVERDLVVNPLPQLRARDLGGWCVPPPGGPADASGDPPPSPRGEG